MTSDDRLQSSAPRITQDSLAPIRRNATWLLVVFLLALSFFAGGVFGWVVRGWLR